MSERGQSREEIELTKLIRESFPELGRRQFSPCALYFEKLDKAEVIIEDTSWSEVMISRTFSLHERNHDTEDRLLHVGFSINGIVAFCRAHGLNTQGQVMISNILQKIAEVEPKSKPAILDVALPMLKTYNLDFFEYIVL